MTAVETPDRLTVVIIDYKTRRRNHRLLFGRPRLEIRRGWRRRLAAFAPGDIFGYVRWRTNKYGTQDWRLFICQCVKDGNIARIPGVLPGADILLSAYGRTRVKRALDTIDNLRNASGSIEKTAADNWRVLHCAIETGEQSPEALLLAKRRSI